MKSPVFQGLVGVLLALGLIGGISILGSGTVALSSVEVQEPLGAPIAEPAAPMAPPEMIEGGPVEGVAVPGVDEPGAPLREDAELPVAVEMVEEEVAEVQRAAEFQEVEAAGAPQTGEDLTGLATIVILSLGVALAAMVSMGFIQRRTS